MREYCPGASRGLYSISIALGAPWPALGITSLDRLAIGCGYFVLHVLRSRETLRYCPASPPFPGKHGWPVWADHDREPAETTVWPGRSGDLQVAGVAGQRAEARVSSCTLANRERASFLRRCENVRVLPECLPAGSHWFIVWGRSKPCATILAWKIQVYISCLLLLYFFIMLFFKQHKSRGNN